MTTTKDDVRLAKQIYGEDSDEYVDALALYGVAKGFSGDAEETESVLEVLRAALTPAESEDV